ncbi:MAG: polysaccharide biosynthesis/export family protein [Bacteroidota bacterium]|nr:polysaccharide biosynthesis/export family protein [Bacteroidota bacterium]
MKTRIIPCIKLFLLYITSSHLLISCTSTKEAVYFNNLSDSLTINSAPPLQQTINSNDILSITVGSLNPEATVIFNNPNPGLISSATGGYLVDQDGYVQFPVLGKIKAAGLTKKELTEFLRNTLVEKKLLVDPVVAVRFLNFRITVLGEVSRPMVVAVPNEKISILEAIGVAGDLTIYARRDNILLIREENGQKILKRINLNSGDIFKSPYYYLKSNDIVYAEPNKSKIYSTSKSRQVLPVILSALSLAAIIVDRATRKR